MNKGADPLGPADDLTERVALAIESTMWAPHELPLDEELHAKYYITARAAIAAMGEPLIARPLTEWHEDFGDVLWWRFPLSEAPWVGTPNTVGTPIEMTIRDCVRDYTYMQTFGGWPGYHTHWTPLPRVPECPVNT